MRFAELRVQEALRMFPALPFPELQAVKDVVIPLSESISLKTGQRINQIPVRKGQTVFVGIASYQQLADVSYRSWQCTDMDAGWNPAGETMLISIDRLAG
jgi:hypothetical protein